ncbi:MAG: Protein of unknown function (DUF2793) [Rhodobacteraceae bacterium HLUCCA12]|nr:MAG: Protein of unknown function (DUF2793) [Rhodobacteraceae bacterium HLUCCA12]
MSDQSPRLSLPYIQAAQAQKHVTVNEAIQLLDLLVQLVVEEFDATLPPSLPQDGQVWAIGETPGGVWAENAGMLAAWVQGGWLFWPPVEGCRAWGRTQAEWRIWHDGGWQRPITETANLPGIGINAGHDTTNRLAVSAPATLLSHDGSGHQVKINKATSADTASVLFQTGWSGRAEMGTSGGDGFAIKVAQDGDTWHTGLALDPASGQAQLPMGAEIAGAITAGAGAGNLPGLRSDASDTGVVTTSHDRLVLASADSRASGQRAVVISSDGAVASGASAMALASDDSTLTGTRAFAASSLSGAIGGYDGALISTLESGADGFRTAVMAAYASEVDAGDAMVVCSRRVRNTVTRSLAIGDAASGAASRRQIARSTCSRRQATSRSRAA